MTIVAISREMGSEGYAIAAAVAKALGFEYVDRQIILKAAEAHGVPEQRLTDAAERHPSLWERFDEERRRYLAFLEAAYYGFAEQGNVVTAGRGGPFLLQDVAHALKVRITAPLAVRVRRIMGRERLDEKTATATVRAYDKETAGRIDYLFGLDWTQPLHFNLVLNTDADDLAFYTDLLVAAARHPRYQPTPASGQRLRDLSLAAYVRAALASDPMTQQAGFDITAHGGQVTLKGVLFRSGLVEAAAKIAARVPGVTGVNTEVVPVPLYHGPMM